MPSRSKSSKQPTASTSAALEQELRTALGTKVDLKHKAGGRGQIVIHFTSADEFDRLREHLCGRAAARRADDRPTGRVYSVHYAGGLPAARASARIRQRARRGCSQRSCIRKISGRGAVWLAHLLWEQGVGGSNPLAPIFGGCGRQK